MYEHAQVHQTQKLIKTSRVDEKPKAGETNRTYKKEKERKLQAYQNRIELTVYYRC